MTTINLAVQAKRRGAYLITDCAWTLPDGRLQKVAGKVISFERFPCAIGVTGNVELLAVGEQCLAIGARNLATLVKHLPGILRRAIEVTKTRYPGSAEIVATLKVAAWSARKGRPVGYMVSSDETTARHNIGADWGAYEVAEVTSSHGTLQHVSNLLGRPCQLEDPDTFDPHSDAFALVAAQRAEGQTLLMAGVAPSFIRIGGEVELTEVSRRGVKLWSCGTFPDKVGELIQR